MTSQQLSAHVKPLPAAQDPAQATRREPVILPPVDIRETADAILIEADMPGVSPESLKVEVADSRLTLEGTLAIDLPEGMNSVDADLRGSHYQRQFTLGQQSIDPEKIRAELKNGVLRVSLQKRESHRTRRIPITS
jgi:HSP20 family molecular chaperone IbpA